MKIFIAGNLGQGNYTPEETARLFPRRLLSFAYRKELDREGPAYPPEDLLVDSGAYSMKYAKSQSLQSISLDDYEAWLSSAKPKYYIQLDSIGDHDATFANYVRMREDGFNPLPVIHYGAPREHIERVLSLGEYVCLGGIARTKADQFSAFMSYVFGHKLARGKRFHLLGITDETILSTFPAYSADSSSLIWWMRFPKSNPRGYRNNVIRSMQLDLWRNKDQQAARNLLEFEQRNFAALEKRLTDLWASRGVVWE